LAESKASYMHQHVVTNVSTFSVCIYTCTCAGDSVGIDDHEKGLAYCTLEFFVQHPYKADGPSDFLYETCMNFIQKTWHHGKGEKRKKLLAVLLVSTVS